MEAAGIECGAKSSGKTGVANQSGVECGALDERQAEFAPDLGAVVKAWPNLPETIRVGVLAMIRAVE